MTYHNIPDPTPSYHRRPYCSHTSLNRGFADLLRRSRVASWSKHIPFLSIWSKHIPFLSMHHCHSWWRMSEDFRDWNLQLFHLVHWLMNCQGPVAFLHGLKFELFDSNIFYRQIQTTSTIFEWVREKDIKLLWDVAWGRTWGSLCQWLGEVRNRGRSEWTEEKEHRTHHLMYGRCAGK